MLDNPPASRRRAPRNPGALTPLIAAALGLSGVVAAVGFALTVDTRSIDHRTLYRQHLDQVLAWTCALTVGLLLLAYRAARQGQRDLAIGFGLAPLVVGVVALNALISFPS